MTDVVTTHAEGCWAWGPQHHACAVREIERLCARVADAEAERDNTSAALLMIGSEVCGDPKIDAGDKSDPRWVPTLAYVAEMRARVAELERDLDACRAELLEARHAVGEEWFADGATLAEGVARKCRMLEGDAEHWRRAAEARSLRAEDGDHALHRFAALAAAKNEGRSAITLTVWSDGTVDAEQYATLDGELDEWGTLYQERRASWGSRPIGELDALVDDLESGDWYTVEHRAPQGFWGEIAVLRDEVERLRDDIEMACENSPWPGCECPGCETARERAEAELNGGDR